MYAKVFESIYDGSLRKNWKALVVFQQFLILSDDKGYVDKTLDAIAARTGIPLDFIREGALELEKPDPDSRSQDEEGRRIVLINPARKWGWRVVNYQHYKAITSREDLRDYWSGRQRAYRNNTKINDRLSRFKATLSSSYKRDNGIVWPCLEEQALAEICRRETADSELNELLARRKQDPKFFPRSIAALLRGWQETLDRYRQDGNGHKSPYSPNI